MCELLSTDHTQGKQVFDECMNRGRGRRTGRIVLVQQSEYLGVKRHEGDRQLEHVPATAKDSANAP